MSSEKAEAEARAHEFLGRAYTKDPDKPAPVCCYPEPSGAMYHTQLCRAVQAHILEASRALDDVTAELAAANTNLASQTEYAAALRETVARLERLLVTPSVPPADPNVGAARGEGPCGAVSTAWVCHRDHGHAGLHSFEEVRALGRILTSTGATGGGEKP